MSIYWWWTITHIREDFDLLIISVAGLFLLYYLVYIWGKRISLSLVLAMIVLVRIPFFFSEPQLSDDLYRFIWDGRMLAQGMSPYDQRPMDIGEEKKFLIDPHSELLENMNSAQYHSVYTPLNQLIFGALNVFGGYNFSVTLFVYHLFFLLVDVLATFLIFRLLLYNGRFAASGALLYGFNPLVVVEGVGNFHFETVVSLLILLSLYFGFRKKWSLSSLSFFGAMGIKLIPIIFLPMMLKTRKFKLWAYALFSVTLLLSSFAWIFFFPDSMEGFQNSLRLYFVTFEFNASVYYIFRALVYKVVGYNAIAIIGPLLSFLFIGFALIFAWLNRKKVGLENIAQQATWVWIVFYLLSTTVHPWYIIPALALGILGRLSFPTLWSALIFLSYSHYEQGMFKENFWLISLEYGVLALAILLEHSKISRRLLKIT